MDDHPEDAEPDASQLGPPTVQRPTNVAWRLLQLTGCALAWLLLSRLDVTNPGWSGVVVAVPEGVVATYQWAMVAHLTMLVCALLRLACETDTRAAVSQATCAYACLLYASGYHMLRGGAASAVAGHLGSIFIPQQHLLNLFVLPVAELLLPSPATGDARPGGRATALGLPLTSALSVCAAVAATAPWTPPELRTAATLSLIGLAPVFARKLWCGLRAAGAAGFPAVLLVLLTVGSYIGGSIVVCTGVLGSHAVWRVQAAYGARDCLVAALCSVAMSPRTRNHGGDDNRGWAEGDAVPAQAIMGILRDEVRVPLSTIVGLMELLSSGSVGPLSDKMCQVVVTMSMSSKRALQVTDSILDSVRKNDTSVTMAPTYSTVHVGQVLCDVMKLVEPLKPSCVVLVNNMEELPLIQADVDQLAQVFFQILSNAVKFTRTGSVHVSSSMDSLGTRISVSIADTGHGMAQAKVDRLLQGCSGGGSDAHSSLHLVHAIVLAHNGSLQIKSTIGKGTKLTVRLPVSAPCVAPPDQSGKYGDDFELKGKSLVRSTGARKKTWGGANTGESNGSGGGGDVAYSGDPRRGGDPRKRGPATNHSTESLSGGAATAAFHDVKKFHHVVHGTPLVLSVDDDPINQMVIEDLLSNEGYKIVPSLSGHEALDYLDECETLPDIILMDVMMPDMSGYDVCRTIRERFSLVSIPVIIVSARNDPEDVMAGLSSGSVDYIKKPYHRQELLGRIRAQLRNRQVIEAEVQNRKVTERLKSMMPMSVIDRLGAGHSMIADAHASVTVLFANVAGFWSSGSSRGWDHAAGTADSPTTPQNALTTTDAHTPSELSNPGTGFADYGGPSTHESPAFVTHKGKGSMIEAIKIREASAGIGQRITRSITRSMSLEQLSPSGPGVGQE
ncbi:hypothetical protein FOA52_010767 [Chlamydomonas sp. UWO 241]|nr:hypothetical protein FOA52_010767 [Chlamydomonas sp. UWO 241]